MSPAETCWRTALKELQRAVEAKDVKRAERARANEAVCWSVYRREMAERARKLSQPKEEMANDPR
jgi:hypothetical protein